MNQDSILSFIARRPLESSLMGARAHLESLQLRLDSMANPRFEELNQRRILSSGSLLDYQDERMTWDQANAFVGQQLLAGVAPSREGLKALHAILVRGSSGFRDRPVFGGVHEYLPLAHFPEALRVWEEAILKDPDPILRAALSYIWLINVHPFENGNGRCARLLADWILMGEGYLPLCFPSHVQGHVAYGHADRYPSMDECVLKCFHALAHSYELVIGPVTSSPAP